MMERFEIDPAHSVVEFLVRHLVISKVRGAFTSFHGTVMLDTRDLAASSVEACIDTASIDTNEPQRDRHLRSPDFLDAGRFPEMCFRSSRVELADSDLLRVFGELSMHGVTREVVLDAQYGGRVTDPWGHERVGFEATAVIDRRDFGLIWNAALEAGGVLVGDILDIDIQIEAVAAPIPEPVLSGPVT
jgi:polyisoprenoid-binding protein YceI